jgi:pimeloyl-ACP methyl ester carboxylesterase
MTHAEDIASVIEQLGLRKAVSVGHRMGGLLRAGSEVMVAAIEAGDQPPGGGSSIMYGGTAYEHLMVPVKEGPKWVVSQFEFFVQI